MTFQWLLGVKESIRNEKRRLVGKPIVCENVGENFHCENLLRFSEENFSFLRAFTKLERS